MRKHHVAAVIVVLVLGVGAKQFFYPAEKARADVKAGLTMNVLQMHIDRPDHAGMPAQTMRDMTFVFEDEHSDDQK